jgi:hypothetical protein
VLHLRIICPAEATDAVLDALRSNPGAVHLNVLRGAAVDPPGDLVQADVVARLPTGCCPICVHSASTTLAGSLSNRWIQCSQMRLTPPRWLRQGIPPMRWCGTSLSRSRGAIRS